MRDALLIIDVINGLAFPGGEKVLPWAKKLAPRLAAFRRKAHAAGVPVIYVNDNFGLWHSDFTEIYGHCTRKSARGRDIARRLKPNKRDFFILKPQQSAFYATSLTPLLDHLKVDRLILAGIATNLCVLFSAHDGHMRRYKLVVLSDCCAAESDFDHNLALSQLKQFLGVTICLSTEFTFTPPPAERRTRAVLK